MSFLISLLRNGRIRDLLGLKEAMHTLRHENDAPDTSADRFLETLPAAQRGDLGRLKRPSFFDTDAHLRQGHRADWNLTTAEIRTFAHVFIETMRRDGIPMFVHTAWRDPLEQAKLKAAGRSQTVFPAAAHCQGEAVDLVHGIYAWELSKGEWDAIGVAGKRIAQRFNIPITWGGDWSFYDPAHWEVEDWRARMHASIPNRPEPLRIMPRKLAKLHPVTQLAGPRAARTVKI